MAHPSPCAGDTPLHQLVSYSYAGDEAVLALLQAGARHLVHAANAAGATPLHLATRCAYFQGMGLLLAAGASVNAADRSGRTSLHYAALLPQYAGEAVRLLCEQGRVSGAGQLDASGRAPLHLAAEAGDPEAVRQLLLCGAPADGRAGDTGETALHLAARGGHTGAARVLLSGGASRAAQCNSGLLPMDAALAAGHRALGEALAPQPQDALLAPPPQARSSSGSRRGERRGSAGGASSPRPPPTPPPTWRGSGSGSRSGSVSGSGGGGGGGGGGGASGGSLRASPFPQPPHTPPPPRRNSGGPVRYSGGSGSGVPSSPAPPPPPGPPPRFASRPPPAELEDDAASFRSADDDDEEVVEEEEAEEAGLERAAPGSGGHAAAVSRAGWSSGQGGGSPAPSRAPLRGTGSPAWEDPAEAQAYIARLEERVDLLEQQLRDPAALRRLLAAAEGRLGQGAGGSALRVTLARPWQQPSAEDQALEKAELALAGGGGGGSGGSSSSSSSSSSELSGTAERVDADAAAPSSAAAAPPAQEAGLAAHTVALHEGGDAGSGAQASALSSPPSPGGSGSGSDSPSARTLSIWTAFFENAARFRASGGGAEALSEPPPAAASAGPERSPAALSLMQALALRDLAAVERLLLLGAPCTLCLPCPAPLLPAYPPLTLDSGGGGGGGGGSGGVVIALAPCAGLRVSALHVAAASGSLGALELLGDAALMEREAGGEGEGEGEGQGALDGSDGRGAWPLLLCAALALHHAAQQPASEASAAAARAHAACARHLLGAAADCSLTRRTAEGVSLREVLRGLAAVGQGQGQGALECRQLAALLGEYAGAGEG